MATKSTKNPATRKKAAPKPSTPRKRVVKAATSEQPPALDDDPVRYVFQGTAYELERTPEGYTFGGQTFKSLAGFGKHLEALYGKDEAPAPADEAPAPPPRPRKMPAPKTQDPRLVPGVTLTRTYKGREIKVQVQDDGSFLYEGQTFGSISGVAKHIVGYMMAPR